MMEIQTEQLAAFKTALNRQKAGHARVAMLKKEVLVKNLKLIKSELKFQIWSVSFK